MKMKVAVIVPNWNGEDLLELCLHALEGQSYQATVVVVDNGSTDNSVGMVKQRFPKVKVLSLDNNYGFTGGVNAGITHALNEEFDAIALCNNDATPKKDWLEYLVKRLETSNKIGIVTGKLLKTDEVHFDSTGEMYTTWGVPFPRGRNLEDSGQYDQAEEVFGATGGASLYRTFMLREVGLFDDVFFAYLEDVDLSFRARLAGWEVWYEPKAVATHQIGATSSKLGKFANYHFIKNFHLTYLKNMPGWLFLKYLPFAYLQNLRMFVGSIAHGHFVIFLRAYWRAVWLIPYALRQRKLIQSKRSVSLEKVEELFTPGRPPLIPKL